MGISLSGLATGFDWQSLVDQLAEAERTPQTRLRIEQSTLAEQKNTYGSIVTQLSVLQTRAKALASPDLFGSRQATVADATIASASVAAGALQGSYTFNFQQLATASKQTGASNAGAALSTIDDVSTLSLANAGFATPVTAGKFTVNGVQITVAADDTLGEVFQNIHDTIFTATGQDVTASYDHLNDTIRLNSNSGPLVLGSGTDTSNFLDAARLNNNGLASITSSGTLGSVKTTATLSNANLSTAINYGTGTASFKINGTEVTFAATDTVNDVVKRINTLQTGVVASYDSVNDRFILNSKTTGDQGISLQDVEGNFLAATGLLGGQLDRGRDLLYTVNGGGTLRSHSNSITESSSGLAGVTVTALKENATTSITVNSDTSKIKTAINDFLTEFNKVQSIIDSATASTTDSKGKVTAGVLASESDASAIATSLRGLVYSQISGLAGTLKHLDSLGIVSNGTDNTLTLKDSAKLDTALGDKLSEVQDLFTNSTYGIAVNLDKYLEKTVGDDGTLPARQDNLTKQSANLDTQIADMEKMVQSNRARMIDSFVAMETAQAKIQQQLKFLQQNLGIS